MNRRAFTRNLAAAAALVAMRSHAQTRADVTLEIDLHSRGATMPSDFTGLSYESAQLANPQFFSTANPQLIRLFRELTPHGVLRLGGGSSNFTTYSDIPPSGPPPFETFGPDTSKTVKTGTVTSSLSLRSLRAFLDAANWTCLYGLNLGRGTKENAVREATAAHLILGPRLIALQIGNEPDSFRNRYRPASYGPADFMKEWNDFHTAILGVVPRAKFAGPDISNKIAFFEAFAEQAPQYPDVILLTAHAYAMGPAGSPQATLDKLLENDARVQTQPENKLDAILAAAKAAHLPYRMCEGNSCWNGGEPGVSNTLASALWCGDYMLQLAQKEVAGVNMHGGGNGYYTPIAGAPSTGLTRRPEYLGIKFAQKFARSTFVPSKLQSGNPRLTAYVSRRDQSLQLAVFNKSTGAVSLSIPTLFSEHIRHTETIFLTGSAFDSKQAVLSPPRSANRPLRLLDVPAHTATLYKVELA